MGTKRTRRGREPAIWQTQGMSEDQQRQPGFADLMGRPPPGPLERRGEELAMVLRLADLFPAEERRPLAYPRFPRR